MAVIKINGADIKTPTSFEISLMDIDSGTTTRTADGSITRDRVCGAGNAKRKIELEWAGLTQAEASSVLQAISGVFFSVTYPDPYAAGERTAQFYAGDRSLPMYSANLHGRGVLWEKLKVNLIEK